MTAAGLVFSNIHDANLPEMTAQRTMASLPFGGRYRLVDFTLSNMVNAGITKVGIVTHNNYRSLVDHIGTGKDWDLARRSGGVVILPPFITAFNNPRADKLYATRLEALIGTMGFIERCNEEIIVLSDCDMVCNIDIADVIDEHEKNGADVTIVTTKADVGGDTLSGGETIVYANDDGVITDFAEYTQVMTGEQDISTNIMVFNKAFLLTMLHNSIAHGYTDFYHQALPYSMYNARFLIYRFDGMYAEIDSLAHYFAANMSLLERGKRDGLFSVKDRPVYTKVRNSPPTKYGYGANVKNSLIADGCVIEGTVENSILFRGVRVRKGTVVRNSILLQDTTTGENVSLNCVISDKNVIIRDDVTLAGHKTMPFYISKGKMI